MSLKMPSSLVLGALLFLSASVHADWSVDVSLGAANTTGPNFKPSKDVFDATLGYQLENWRWI